MTGKNLDYDVHSEGIARRRRALTKTWAQGWSRMMDQWRNGESDAMWLMYSAGYLMRTSRVKWAIDPVTLRNKVENAATVDVSALDELSFILQTHADSDHVDMELLRKLARMDVFWVVPPHMANVSLQAGVPSSRIITAEPMRPIRLDGVTVTPFDGLHWQYAGRWGVGEPVGGTTSTGYLIEWDRHRLLLPGDTRTYQADALPRFGPVDTLVAHVWLGRNAALTPDPPLLREMCDFIFDLQPKRRVILAHLWQVARRPDAYWDKKHAELVREYMDNFLPNIEIIVPDFWRQVDL